MMFQAHEPFALGKRLCLEEYLVRTPSSPGLVSHMHCLRHTRRGEQTGREGGREQASGVVGGERREVVGERRERPSGRYETKSAGAQRRRGGRGRIAGGVSEGEGAL